VILSFSGGSGGTSDAKVNLFGFQAGWIIRILLVFFLAGDFGAPLGRSCGTPVKPANRSPGEQPVRYPTGGVYRSVLVSVRFDDILLPAEARAGAVIRLHVLAMKGLRAEAGLAGGRMSIGSAGFELEVDTACRTR